MTPIGDKVVLERKDIPERKGVVLGHAGTIFAQVVEVGAGVPYGRGEFYSTVVAPGDFVFLSEKDWEAAPVLRLSLGHDRPKQLRVVHERQILVKVAEEDL
jgi:co-chaperonin GroES (HSP10)